MLNIIRDTSFFEMLFEYQP